MWNALIVECINYELIINRLLTNDKSVFDKKKYEMNDYYYMALENKNYDLTQYNFPLSKIPIFCDMKINKTTKLNVDFNKDNTIYENVEKILKINIGGSKNGEISNVILIKFIISLCHIEFKEKEEVVNVINNKFRHELNELIKDLIENNNKMLLDLISNTYFKNHNDEVKEKEIKKTKRF